MGTRVRSEEVYGPGLLRDVWLLGVEEDLGKIENVMGEVCCCDDFGCVSHITLQYQ